MPKAATNDEPRSPEAAVSYALASATRIDILRILNEGVHSPDDLAEVIGESNQNVAYHLRELLKSSSIEIARVERSRNFEQKFYRAVRIPYFSDEEMAEKTPEERHAIYGLILQASAAEALAAYAAQKMTNDPRVMMAWDWLHLDAEGRDEVAQEQAESWQRMAEIATRAANRRAKSGEPSVSVIVTSYGYERSYPAPQRLPDPED